MHPSLKAILDLLHNGNNFADNEKAAFEQAVKDADKAFGIAEFKLSRFEKEKKSLTVLLEETIEELQKKTFALEQANIDLARAQADVKTAQTQLLQAEKMASLGELTAGIAHEIQNPLNFVNNFSEATEELLQEIEEYLQTGNYGEAAAVIEEAKQNLQKITHHGKRADSVVKGMLQHSRKSDGQKVPTDINALVSEYLQLSYQGLRARDKSMNATLEKNLDNSVGKVDIVPQDIGRVLLNLFNNAFYTVNEKKKKLGDNFDPVVKVETQRTKDGVEISVRDNGTGVSQAVQEKIFQPFFTTKPTGEGTGLGLSLSYDIITNEHNGSIRFETADGEGTTFYIRLPVNAQV